MSNELTPEPTQQLPEQHTTPFRVEPATPVPDDVTKPAGEASTALPPPSLTTPTYPSYAQQPLVTVAKGPRPFTVMLGLLSMIVAGYVLAMNLTTTDLDLRVLGPTTFGALGGLLVFVGLIGVVASGRRRA
jgi:hypothetical protein